MIALVLIVFLPALGYVAFEQWQDWRGGDHDRD